MCYVHNVMTFRAPLCISHVGYDNKTSRNSCMTLNVIYSYSVTHSHKISEVTIWIMT